MLGFRARSGSVDYGLPHIFARRLLFASQAKEDEVSDL